MRIIKVSSDGVYKLNGGHKDAKSVVLASGVFGTATAKIVYKTSLGVPVDIEDGAILSGEQAQVNHGVGVAIYAAVTGSSADTDIEFQCSAID